jgi:hypothetical protein
LEGEGNRAKSFAFSLNEATGAESIGGLRLQLDDCTSVF